MRSVVRAFRQGVADVVKAPMLVVGVAMVMFLIAAPFAAVLQVRLQESLSVQPHVSLSDTEIDPEWWMEFRAHARGLAATFTPAVLGFAATLDGLSGVLDGRPVPMAILAPLVISVVVWAFLWGGALHRFQHRRPVGIRGFVRAGTAHLPRFVAIALAAAAMNLLLYLTLHKLLFGPVHASLVAVTSTERDAFLVRVALYAVFFAFVGGVGLVADYARVLAVAGKAVSVTQIIGQSARFVWGRLGGVVSLYLIVGAIFVTMTIAYGTLEIYGGSQVGGWRAVAIGQAYVLFRLALRLLFAASELRFFNANQAATAE